METKNGYKTKPIDVTLAKAFMSIFKDMKSGKTVYLAFSKRSFHILVFVLAMSVIANIALVDLLVRTPTVIERSSPPMYVAQLILSVGAIISGIWLFLKGVNIITDK